jgi:chromosome segregation ATPase
VLYTSEVVTTKKSGGGRDSRQDSASDDVEEGADKFRVDRVYIPGGGIPAATPQPLRQTSPGISASTASLMTSARTRKASTVSPTSAAETEGELALRRQLSRLQRQLADAQRELANKDEEMAAEVEKRADAIDAHDALLEEIAINKQQLEELLGYRARTTGVEQRLQEAVATADELAHVLELERGKVSAATSRADELAAHFDDARSKWTAERLKLDEQRVSETAQLDQQKRAAIDAAEAAMQGTTERLRAAHEEELTQLRGAHERSVATLRGELEPRALEARGLAEERERLTSELAATRAEAARAQTEATEAHTREVAQLTEQHSSDQNALLQRHTSEVARLTSAHDEKAAALDQATRNTELREQYWENTVNGLREAQKKLQREAAEAKERIAALEADKTSVEERLTSATTVTASLSEANRELSMRAEAAESDARRNSLDRQRFASYLEEGLALLGVIPPTPPPLPEPDADSEEKP